MYRFINGFIPCHCQRGSYFILCIFITGYIYQDTDEVREIRKVIVVVKYP